MFFIVFKIQLLPPQDNGSDNVIPSAICFFSNGYTLNLCSVTSDTDIISTSTIYEGKEQVILDDISFVEH